MRMRRRECLGAAVSAGVGAAGMGAGTVEVRWPLATAATKRKLGGEVRPPDEKFLARLPKLMEIAQLPGIGIGVVQGGKLAWTHYEGFANADAKTRITAELFFPAGRLGRRGLAFW